MTRPLSRNRLVLRDLRKLSLKRGDEFPYLRRAARQKRQAQERIAILGIECQGIAPALEVLGRERRLPLPYADDEDMRHPDLPGERADGEALPLQGCADESVEPQR
jgi:hypothetical protein